MTKAGTREQGVGSRRLRRRLGGWLRELGQAIAESEYETTPQPQRRELEEQVDRLNRSLEYAEKAHDAVARRLARTEELLFAATEGYEVPGLTPAEIERLALLAEECGEAVQAVCKVLRHGWESQSPYGGKTNRVALEREIGNVRAVVNLMLDEKDVRLGDVQAWQRAKRGQIVKWTHHQACSMPRDEQLAMIELIQLNGGSER
ncbi:hypothetical protein [Occallatibacter riparius]|uniref:Uncharacterized protein n=1 Tax=Occallatibacter riparius TaxID=1002689 RepID=A0A9J7BPF5_9BACT|nr:hypothetical protein [Occallatibacter riparius]UWZ84635.1 hypothetical protein MOP44_01570 [Occallatibacter riparius]